MRILTEMVGGIVLLLIFAYGVNMTIKFLSQREKNDVDDERSNGSRSPNAAAERKPD